MNQRNNRENQLSISAQQIGIDYTESIRSRDKRHFQLDRVADQNAARRLGLKLSTASNGS